MSYLLALRASLLFLGAVILLCWGVYHLVPRARYVSSNPPPGAVLTEPPETVSINFSNELSPDSEISVASTVTLSPSGESVYGDGKTFTSAGPDARDPQHKTLSVKLDPALAHGLYWVRWKAVTSAVSAERYGRFCFGVGMPIAANLTRDMRSSFWERNPRFRDYRAVLLAGLLVVAFGVVLPYLPWRNLNS
jgi:methionine-rich copper-binding protein CopC